MEDPEQLQQLKRSVAEWNQWRRQHPDLGPDLSDANLSRANLSGADLSWTDLSGANLSKANLSGADLNGANLSESNLSRANLQKADLSHTDLRGIPWLVIMGSYHFSVPRGILGLSQPNCDSRMIHLKRCNHDGCIKQKGAHAPVGKR